MTTTDADRTGALRWTKCRTLKCTEKSESVWESKAQDNSVENAAVGMDTKICVG